LAGGALAAASGYAIVLLLLTGYVAGRRPFRVALLNGTQAVMLM
jgi:hypothetical protein